MLQTRKFRSNFENISCDCRDIHESVARHLYECPFIRLRSHRSRLFGYTVYVFEGTRILEIKHYDFLIPDHIGGHYSKSSYRRV